MKQKTKPNKKPENPKQTNKKPQNNPPRKITTNQKTESAKVVQYGYQIEGIQSVGYREKSKKI